MLKTQELYQKARKLIPGGTQLLSKRPDQFSLGVWPTYFERAKGIHVWDLDGKEYRDMSIGGIGANVLGYADDDVDNAVIEIIRRGTSSSLNGVEELELAELLCSLHPWAEQARFTRSGGEAMAVAVRIARAHTGKDTIAFCGYHGWQDWYLAANIGTEDALGEHLLSGLSPRGVPKGLQGTALPFRYNHLEELEAIVAVHKGDLAAIVMEPTRGQKPLPGFLEGVRKLASEHNIVFIFDEISAGFRYLAGGAHLTFNVNPDIAVFSKALGNGYPMAAIIGRASVMQAAQDTFISSTNWTERVGPTAALAMIKKFTKHNVAEHLLKIGGAVQLGWSKLGEKHGIALHVGGMTPMGHFTFDGDDHLVCKAYYVQEMLEHGFLASNLFYAMYAHQEKDVFDYLAATDQVFGQLAKLRVEGKLQAALRGAPAVAGFKRLA